MLKLTNIIFHLGCGELLQHPWLLCWVSFEHHGLLQVGVVISQVLILVGVNVKVMRASKMKE